jgi:hypothetical protein
LLNGALLGNCGTFSVFTPQSAQRSIQFDHPRRPKLETGEISHLSLVAVHTPKTPVCGRSGNVRLPALRGTSRIRNTPVQIHALKVTLLSTMLVGSTTGLGEWGFSALIEADGHRVLLDTEPIPIRCCKMHAT